jgi:hypothetical protein
MLVRLPSFISRHLPLPVRPLWANTDPPSAATLLFSLSLPFSSIPPSTVGSYTPSMFEFPPSLIAPSSVPSSSDLPLIPTILVDSRSACLAESGELIASKIAEEDVVEIGGLLDAQGSLKEDEETKRVLQGLRRRGRSLFKCVFFSSPHYCPLPVFRSSTGLLPRVAFPCTLSCGHPALRFR